MSLALQDHADGILLPVKALPGSSQNEFRGVHDGRLKVGVTAVAEQGKANKAIIKFLAAKLELPKSSIALQTGATNASKTFLVKDVSIKELLDRIAKYTS